MSFRFLIHACNCSFISIYVLTCTLVDITAGFCTTLYTHEKESFKSLSALAYTLALAQKLRENSADLIAFVMCDY